MAKVLAAFALAAATGLGIAAGSTAKPACPGTFRWPVKTLSDRAARFMDYSPEATEVSDLRQRSRPSAIGPRTPRLHNEERQVFFFSGNADGAWLAPNGDIVLKVLGRNGVECCTPPMTVVFPDPSCAGAAHSSKHRAIAKARAAFIRACGMPGRRPRGLGHGVVGIEGVGFFDSKRDAAAVAPNGFELHPVLSFHTQDCRRPRP
jgi:hypothetical protein